MTAGDRWAIYDIFGRHGGLNSAFAVPFAVRNAQAYDQRPDQTHRLGRFLGHHFDDASGVKAHTGGRFTDNYRRLITVADLGGSGRTSVYVLFGHCIDVHSTRGAGQAVPRRWLALHADEMEPARITGESNKRLAAYVTTGDDLDMKLAANAFTDRLID
ncbi:MAG: hypothetical protein GDA36_11355 [Rhodobacteraceae bacterium]|nr:hypothetical protein [Paracoccaceae bacterium]